ncbi:MAG: mechanosensitive ion channel [Pseudomonadales bacterium]|nr:mechanosensitive ion channel [Pseudomonadales bacterium]
MDFLERYPEIISILFIFAGFVVATLVSRWSSRGLVLGEGVLRRFAPARAARLSTDGTHVAVKRLTYYVTLSFFLLLAVRILSEGGLSRWLDELLSYVPQLIVGGVIILIGWLLGIATHSLVSSVIQPGQSQLLPRLAQIIVIVTAIMTGLDQMDINISFLANIAIVLIGTFLGGMALAFALGSRQLVSNLLGRRDLESYRIGDRIRIGEIEGTIIELTSTAAVLDVGEGIATVPAARFAEADVLRLRGGQEEVDDDDA